MNAGNHQSGPQTPGAVTPGSAVSPLAPVRAVGGCASTPRPRGRSGGRPVAAGGSRRRSSEGGFVLLTLLFFAAAMAFMLVRALPRSAMQAQRVREETLIYRGEQYKRAVQLYFREYKKYPESLDDLEESDGNRFLRRRYKDPLTGEDEWRLVHMGTNGRFKDSLLFDLEEEEDGNTNPYARGAGRGNSPASSASFAAASAFRGADLARTERQSAAPDLPGQGASAADYLAAGLAEQNPADGADPSQGGQAQDGSVPYPNYATTLPSQIPSPTGAGAPAPYPTPAGAAQPGTLPSNRQSSNRRGVDPRAQAVLNQPGIGGIPQPGAPGNAPPAGFGGAAVGRSAADLIRNLLTTPRPGGLAGLRGAQAAQAQARPSFSEGIAGVASKVEQRGVKVYNERENYNEWEFVYDYRQDAAMAGIGGAAPAGNINPSQPGLNTGGTLQIDPSQGVPVPGTAGFPGMLPGAPQPGVGQPTGGPNPYQQPPGAPLPPGVSPFDPATGAYPQPGQPTTTPNRPDRNTRRRRPPPLPGQSIYPAGGAATDQPLVAPGQSSPFGVPPQPQDPNQPTAPQNTQQP